MIRLFAGDRIYNIIDRLGPTDDDGSEIPLESKMLTKTIENAQKKVEERNFLIRKRVLEYDDVMNQQRRIVYRYRGEILEGRDMSDVAGLDAQLRLIWPVSVDVAGLDPHMVDTAALTEELAADAQKAYDEREQELGDELMRYLERTILLQVIDNRWREHLYDMDYLREGIHLRGFAQIEPIVAYKNEGFSMFEELMNSIWEEFAKLVFNVEVEVETEQPTGAFAVTEDEVGGVDYSGGTLEDQPSALAQPVVGEEAADEVAVAAAQPGRRPGQATFSAGTATKVKGERENIGRNDPCWCGSGKKFKKCHGA